MNRSSDTKLLQPPSAPRSAQDIEIQPNLALLSAYRLRQFWRGITARITPEEMGIAAALLPRKSLARFCEMPADAQRHSFNVLYTLSQEGWHDPDLSVAALLHDVGKLASQQSLCKLTPWRRSQLVLLEAFYPGNLVSIASPDPNAGMRYLIYVHLRHGQIGAEWARMDGCSDTTCWLVAHHQEKRQPPFLSHNEQMLAMLQWADNRN
jgi:hypothetical protein